MRRHFEACRQEQARQFAPWGGGNQKAMIAACLSQVNYAAWERLALVSDNLRRWPPGSEPWDGDPHQEGR